MSEIFEPLLSDGNSRLAKSARARLQPRDDNGRWVPYGAKVVADLELPDGTIVQIEGRSAGGTATKKGQINNIRLLVGKGYEEYGIEPNTILEIDPKNGSLATGIKLDRDYLLKHGIDPDAKADLPEDLADQPQSLEQMKPQPANELDKELAGGLAEDEDALLRAEREKEPVAKLAPAVAEQQLSKEELEDVVSPDAVESDAEDIVSREAIDSAVDDILDGKEVDLDNVIAKQKHLMM